MKRTYISRFCMLALSTSLVFSSLGLCIAASNPVPLVNAPLVPSSAAPGGAGFTLTVNGTGFVAGSAVYWNSSARPTTFISSSKLTAAISVPDIATAGTASVTVNNPAPGGGTSNVTYFDVTLPPQDLLFHRSNFVVGQNVGGGFATGDFNRDGKVDIAAFHVGFTSSLQILLGKGDGTFSSAAVIKTPRGSGGDIVTSDFNGDGIQDLAFPNGILNRVYVLLGNGDGTFKSLPSTQMDQSPNLMAVGDFNGDGKVDLATSNSNNNSISILLGNGDGSFQAPIDIRGFEVPFGLAVGDFNDDGKLDMAVAQDGSTVTILTGNGDGTFAIGNTYVTTNPAQSIVTADLNGDGKLDLVVVNSAESQPGNPEGDWEVFLGNGDGTFQAGVDYSPAAGFISAIAADVNGDGKLDVILNGGPYSTTYAGKLAVLLGNGDGTFQEPQVYAAGQLPFRPAAGDLNGDGRLDLIFEDAGSQPAFSGLIQVPAAFVPTSLSFGKVAVGSTSGSQSVVLTNEGGPALAISGVNVKGTNPGDFTPTNNCPSNLAAGANCSISVTFTPGATGTRSAIVSVSFGGGAIPQGFTVKGTGQ